MKLIDRYVIIYSGLLAVYTIAFRYMLSNSLEHERYGTLWIYVGIYALAIGITAWHLGKAHSLGNFFFDIGIAFHSATYVTIAIVSELWFLLGFAYEHESISYIHTMLLIWGVFLAIHFILYRALRKHTIKGISRSEIF